MQYPLQRWSWLLLLFSFSANAVPLTPAERGEISQRQSDVIEQAQRQREEITRANRVEPIAAQPTPIVNSICFTIRQVEFVNSTLLSVRNKQRLTESYINRCLNVNDINQLIHDVSNWYITQGYVTSRAFLREQDLSSGILTLMVLEGRIETITINDREERALRMVIPARKGDILNLRDLEQGMEQLNRLATQQVKIDILPGEQPGFSQVKLTRQSRIPLSGNIAFDNSGQESTGEHQLNGGLWADNVLGLADQWFISGGQSSDVIDAHHARSLQTGVSLPYGYWNINYDFAKTRYRNDFLNRDFLWRSTGDTQTHRVSLSRVVFRNADAKTSLSAGITHRIAHNYLQDVLLQSSSRRLSSLVFGVNHSQSLWGGLATFNPAFSRGVRWFGAQSDAGLTADSPRAQFNKMTLATSYYLPLSDSVNYLTSFYGQYSPHPLYGSEQVTLGGESSVRGFKEHYLLGDRGGYWRNEINWRARQIPSLGQLTLTAALDGGHLVATRSDSDSAGNLWGAALGMGLANTYLSQQITVGWPLSHPDWMKPDAVVAYYRVGIAF